MDPVLHVSRAATQVYSGEAKIPRILHQSYTAHVNCEHAELMAANAAANPEFDYRYWTDDAMEEFMAAHFPHEKQAYDKLYAMAYKTDIFRLCLLLHYGGVWMDCFFRLLAPLREIIPDCAEVVAPVDHPSQDRCPNIYQAFIASTAHNAVIRSILDTTVDRVMRPDAFHTRWVGLHPTLPRETVAVTGPTIFALGLNVAKTRDHMKFFEEGWLDETTYLLGHASGHLSCGTRQLAITKALAGTTARRSKHYSTLFSEGFVYKQYVEDRIVNGAPTLWQVWLQGRYVSDKMHAAMQTFKTQNPALSYRLITRRNIPEILDERQLRAFHALRPSAFQSDFLRYVLLYKFGGIYADSDCVCFGPLDKMLQAPLMLFCDKGSKPPRLATNDFMAATAGHPYMRALVEACTTNIEKRDLGVGQLGLTGPCLCDRILQAGSYAVLWGQSALDVDQPPPGGWRRTSRKIRSAANLVQCECRDVNGEWHASALQVTPNMPVENGNGRLLCARPADANADLILRCEGQRLHMLEDTVLSISKYYGYNDERLVLGGDSFSKMWENNDIFKP
jgi:mannosyltransferase OCH1-like enzyme